MPPFPVSIQDTNYNVKLGLMCFRTRQILNKISGYTCFHIFFQNRLLIFVQVLQLHFQVCAILTPCN